MNDIVFHPVLPWPLLLAAFVTAAASMGWSLWTGLKSKGRVAVLALWRIPALAALGAVLLQPQRQTEEITLLRPQIAVLVDTSASMTDPVDAAQPRRAQRVKEFLDSTAVRDARKNYDVRAFDLAQTELPAGQPPASFNANASDLTGGLRALVDHFKGQPLAAVLLLSDGLDTTGVARPENTAFTVPVDTFELERPFKPKKRPQRLSIVGADYPRRAVVGWHSGIQISLAGSGLSGRVVPVELWRGERKVAEATAAFNEDEQTRGVTFEVTHDQPGTDQYEVRVPDPAADKEARAYPVSIAVAEPGRRVLYVQNQLSFDYKFLRKAIVSNRNLQLSSFTRWADGRIVSLDDRGGPAPVLDFSPRALANNAVIILGDLAPDALPPESWKNLRDYVDRGGGLVLLGGPAAFTGTKAEQTPLADALPVRPPTVYREGNFPVQITETGLHHPVFGPVFAQVKDFPPLLTANVGGRPAPSAEVLMQTLVDGKAEPLVAAVRFGGGRIVSVLSDSVWRWRLGAAQWRQDQSPYELFWTQLLDWLVPKESNGRDANTVELFTERSSYVLGEKPEVRALVQTAAGQPPPGTLPLRLRTPDDRTLDYTLRPGNFPSRDGKPVRGYTAVVEPNVAGLFRAETTATLSGGPATGETRFVVTPPATELTGKPVNRDFLQKLATASKGRYYPLGAWDGWLGDLHVAEQHSTRLELTDLWNHPALIGLIVTLLAAEWITRKIWHLP